MCMYTINKEYADENFTRRIGDKPELALTSRFDQKFKMVHVGFI